MERDETDGDILRITPEDIGPEPVHGVDLRDPSLFKIEPEVLLTGIEVRCARTKQPYYLLFEPAEGGVWRLVRSSQMLWGMGGVGVKQSVSGDVNWSRLYAGKARCPHCGNISVAQCASCAGGHLSCLNDWTRGTPFECGWCGFRGALP